MLLVGDDGADVDGSNHLTRISWSGSEKFQTLVHPSSSFGIESGGLLGSIIHELVGGKTIAFFFGRIATDGTAAFGVVFVTFAVTVIKGAAIWADVIFSLKFDVLVAFLCVIEPKSDVRNGERVHVC